MMGQQADCEAVDGPVSLVVLEGRVGCIVGYSIGNGKFEWLPFALPMDKVGSETPSWADVVTKITQKCKGVRATFFTAWPLTDCLFLTAGTSVGIFLEV